MKLIFRFFSNIKRYYGYLLLNMLSNILFVLTSFFSLTMVAPFLSVLFGLSESVSKKPTFKINADTFLDYLYYYMGLLQNEYGNFYALVVIALAFMAFSIVSNLFRYLGMFFITPIRSGLIRDLRNEFYSRIMHLPLAYFSEQRRGDILSRLTSDMNEVEWAIVTSIQSFFKDPLNVILFLIALFAIDAPLTLFIIVLLPFIVWLIARIGKKLKAESDKGRIVMGDVMSLTEESIGGIRVIKSFNLIDYVCSKFRHKNNLYARIANQVNRRQDLSDPLTEVLLIAVMVTVLWFGGSQVLEQSLSADKLILFILLFSRLISPAKATVNAYYNLQKGRAALERIYKIIDEPDQFKQKENPILKTDFNHEIIYSHVYFRYPTSERNILENIQLRMEKGKTYAFVGASGSGKTTTVDLLSRFYDVGAGSITIDGCDVRDLKLYDLRQLIGMVTQMPFVWNDTIAENICFGGNYTMEEIIDASKKANAHSFIMDLSKGYNTMMGDMGVNLSGGQRQRIVIARAILKNSPILVLDEATSALDTKSELLVQQALIKLMSGRTSIVIAHRLSTIRHADRIFVFENGKIIEEGNHEELLALNGPYSHLVNLQNIE